MEGVVHGLTRDLQALGLSAVEARIIVAMLSLKKSTASEIARVAKLGRSEVYRKLPNLASLGILRKVAGPPDCYETYDVSEILDCLYQEQTVSMRQKLQSMKHTQAEIINRAKMLPAVHGQEIIKPRRVIINNRRKALDEVLQMLKNSTGQIQCVLDAEAFKLWYSDGLINHMLKRASKKIAVKMILQLDKEIVNHAQSLGEIVDIRLIPQVAFNTLIIDQQWTLAYSSASSDFEATINISKDFASREVIVFEQLWKIGRSPLSLTYEQLVGTQIVKAVKGVDESTEAAMKLLDRSTSKCMFVFDTDGYVSLGWLLSHRPHYVDQYKMVIFKALKRGVQLRLVGAGSLQNMGEVSDLASVVQFRILPKATSQFILSENEVIMHPPNVADLSPEEAMFFWSDHESMVQTFWGLAEDIWNSATPIPMPTPVTPQEQKVSLDVEKADIQPGESRSDKQA